MLSAFNPRAAGARARLSVRSVSLVLALALCAAAGSAAASTLPSQYFDLSHWKLNLPVDADGTTTGEAAEVQPAQLSAGYSSQWFSMASSTSLDFWAPVDGATTSGSHYPRSELRELLDPSDDNHNWTLADASSLQAKCKIVQVPSSTGKLVVGQIHGFQTAPLIKLVYAYSSSKQTGSVYALINATPDATAPTKIALAADVALGQAFNYEIDVANVDGAGVLSMRIDSQTPVSYTVDHHWDGIGLYYKVGDYVQANGDSDTDGGSVVFYRFIATHPDNGLSITTGAVGDATSNDWYSQPLASSGGTGAAQWSVVNGVLPAGLSLSGNGVLSGTPAPVAAAKTYYFSLQITDELGGTAARNYGLKVSPSP